MKKRIIIVLGVIVISLVIVRMYQTFASSFTVGENDTVYNITLTDSSTVTVPAKSSKIVYYQVCNTNNGTVQYAVGYTSNNIIVKTYWDTIDADTGLIDYGENKFIKLKLINDSNEEDTITLSTVLGFEFGGDLIIPSDITLVSQSVSEKNEVTGESEVSSTSSTFLGGDITRTSVSTVTFETDNIVPEGAISVKDISSEGDGSVMMWYTENTDGSYELHMGSENGKVSITNGDNLFAHMDKIEILDFTNVDLSGLTSMANMFRGSTSLKQIKFGDNKLGSITDLDHAFYKTESLTTLDLSGFDTSNVTDMSSMFAYSGVEYLDLRSFDTSNVTNMSGMFHDCPNLQGIDLSSFDTSKVTGMGEMFYNCPKIEKLDLSGFDTSRVTSMYAMFGRCTNLSSLDISNFNTSNVKNMCYMFNRLHMLTNLELSHFDTSKVTNMSYMFQECRSLANLNLSSFDTSKVTDMSYMFQDCSSLANLDISSFVTPSVTDTHRMFNNCSSLTSLDLSGFNMSSVTRIDYMFSRCSKLITIYVSNLWNMSNITDSTNMFYKTESLVGGAGTTYNSSYVDATYARVDGGTSSPGYFTLKNINVE